MIKKEYSVPLRWGIIGCGDVTEVKSGPAYQKTEGFELVAVMRRDEIKLKDYAHRHGIEKYYTSADALIHDDDIDAVYIATTPDSHRHYALKVAEAGKPCCIEKPLAPSYRESSLIYEAFKKKDIPLFVAYYRRSLPRFNRIKDWLSENKIGEIRHINWHLSQPPNAVDLFGEYNWRTDPMVAPGGYFDDLASHGLDLFIYLLGEIQKVSGISLNQQGLYAAKDAISACWLHKGGVTGAGVWNFGIEPMDRVEIFGSIGKIQFSVFEENPLILYKDGKMIEFFIEHPKHVQLPHVENMKKHLLEKGLSHPSSGQTAVHTSWVMDQILGHRH
ncbi:MAG: Gfo/Idh/MocA family oxidoreductase [Bacteroidota bacterium]|nr:Gfo/Idh/MocA family oxidoreductase [Bacteroidota bacterium]